MLTSNTIYFILLVLHVGCGILALSSASIIMLKRKGDNTHRKIGRYFFYGMTGIFFTAIPMSFIKSDWFLFLISLFSYYLAISGMRYAQNRQGIVALQDWLRSSIMLIISAAMIVFGAIALSHHNMMSYVIIIFGAILINLSMQDLYIQIKGGITGKKRIARHLGDMIGGLIAVVTAVCVVNIHTSQPLLVWMAPTIILVPVLRYWVYRVNKGSITRSRASQ
ncbi:MAG: hypothetical protein K0U29_07010 [Gammaproteobacteria bacterium]|nr:hypothetical protein [Gammaproteobacteria bacterium]